MGKHLADTAPPQRPPLWHTKITLSAVLMLIVVAATIYGFRWLTTEQPRSPEPTVAVDRAESATVEPAQENEPGDDPVGPDTTIIHVAGAVHQPGIVELETGSRVVDAIEGAGGPTEAAILDALNLAAIVNDGDYILVPDEHSETQAEASPGSPGGSATGPGNPSTVNLNTADATQLETLPGVGPATAEQIIAHRQQHGPFTQLADIEAVSGIGPATRERLDGLVSW